MWEEGHESGYAEGRESGYENVLKIIGILSLHNSSIVLANILPQRLIIKMEVVL